MKSWIKKVISKKYLGYYDFLKNKDLRKSWGGPFNGQEFRQKIFLQIIKTFEVDLIVETGTFRGTTTEFMLNKSNKKIVTVESNERFYGFSKFRFFFRKNIKVYHDHSVDFLNKILDSLNTQEAIIFLYLDAHWEENLPLVDELKIIFSKCKFPIVMIDDFQVPKDTGYKYDDYGEGKSLTIDILKKTNEKNIYSFYPSKKSENETGEKRGCIVLTHSNDIKINLLSLSTLKFNVDDKIEL